MWTVHCTVVPEERSPKCLFYSGEYETKKEAEALALERGWHIGRQTASLNICPQCRVFIESKKREKHGEAKSRS